MGILRRVDMAEDAVGAVPASKVRVGGVEHQLAEGEGGDVRWYGMVEGAFVGLLGSSIPV